MAKTIPVLLLKDFVLLPNQEVKVETGPTFSFETLTLSETNFDGKLLIVSPIDTLEEKPEIEDLPRISVIAKIKKKITLPNGTIRVTFVGQKRVKVSKYYNYPNYDNILVCDYFLLQKPNISNSECISLKKELKRILKKYVNLNPHVSNNILQNLEDIESLSDFVDTIAAFLPMTLENKISYVKETSTISRAKKLLEDLTIELKVLKLDQKINQSLQKSLEDNQKEFVLREKIREIEKELGEENKKSQEVEHYRSLLKNLNLPQSTYHKISHEILKYEFMNEMSPEISFVRNYLDLFFDLPWNEETIECEDLKLIETSLNKTHYGLKNVKTRVLEYVAMRKRNPLLQAPIICLVGPPGVGKSTIASSIAKALHRKFYKISVGGLNDSSELTGHRRTYLGSAPGKIITALQKCGSKNPLILIDEVDKMVKDYKGDPASVLLDILDSNLNQNFVDSYLEEPMDLSHVLFFLTANHIEDIPNELKDRLEIIELSSYSIFEKIEVAKDYLLPHIHLDYHILQEDISITDSALKTLILDYTNEAGVRDLKRHLEELYRKVLLHSIKNKQNLGIIIDKKDIKRYLEEKMEVSLQKPSFCTPGLVLVLAVTETGGTILPIESTLYAGSGKCFMTGLIGEVMKESLEVVFSYLKSHAKELDVSERLLKSKDVHIHALEGAIKKDGPSAGVAILTSLISLFTNKVVSMDISMTGEMTLRGEILPVGGVKEKVIGAYNRGIKTVILPERNKIDLKQIPKEVKNNVSIIFVKEYKDVFKIVFSKK